MADKERRLKWLLWADAKKFKEGLNTAKKDLGGFQKTSKSMFLDIQKAAIAAFSVTAIYQYGKAAVQAANESQQAEAKLLTAMKGRAGATRELIDLASQLQGKTLFDDDVTVEAAAQLAVFIKNEEQIKRLLPAIQDMATVLKMDLAQAATLVGKTIGASTNALARYGISVEGAAGSAERAESAIAALTSKFEGQSAAAAKTGTGAVTQLKNAVGDLNEQVGALIITWQNFLATSKFVKGVLSETKKTLTILSARGDFTFWEKFISPFESQSKTYARALKVIEERTKDVQQGFYDMAQESIKPDDPLMVSMQNLLATVRDLAKVTEDKSAELGKPKPDVLTEYEKLAEELSKLQKTQSDYAAQNKDISDITARVASVQLQIDKIDELIKKQTEAAMFSVKYGGTYTPATSISGQAAGPIGGSSLDTTTLVDMSLIAQENLQEVEDYYAQIQKSGERVAQAIQGTFENMVVGVSEAFAALAAGTGSMTDVAKALMNPIADLAISLGVILLGVGKGIEALKASLATITGPIAIIAGAALIALGTAAKAGVASLGSSGGGSYSGSSGTYDTRKFSAGQQTYGLKASAMKIEVVGQTQIKNKDIYIAFKNAESSRKQNT